jgi:hypothetical protein
LHAIAIRLRAASTTAPDISDQHDYHNHHLLESVLLSWLSSSRDKELVASAGQLQTPGNNQK